MDIKDEMMDFVEDIIMGELENEFDEKDVQDFIKNMEDDIVDSEIESIIENLSDSIQNRIKEILAGIEDYVEVPF